MKKRIGSLIMAGVLTMGSSGVVLAGNLEPGSGMEVSVQQIEQRETAQVQKVSLETEQVSAIGGEVKVTVTGTGLTGENWGIEAKAYIVGTDFEMSQYEVQVKDVTAEGAVLVIPSNTMKNVIEYRITAGKLNNGRVEVQAETSLLQDKKADNVNISPRSVEMTDSQTIVASFREDVLAVTDDMERLKSLIFVADYGNENSGRYDLQPGDTVEVKDRQVTVHFQEDVNISDYSALYIKEGALKNADGLVLRDISWLITADTQVSGILIENEVLDSKGGEVMATLVEPGLASYRKGLWKAKS